MRLIKLKRKEIEERISQDVHKLTEKTKNLSESTKLDELISFLTNLSCLLEKQQRYSYILSNLSDAINSERTESRTVISKIRLDYDEDGISRTLTKCIYETWNPEIEQWHLKKIEYLFDDDSELPVSSDNIEAAAHTRDGRLIPSEWIFVDQEFVCTRQSIEVKQRGHTYDHESDVLVKGK